MVVPARLLSTPGRHRVGDGFYCYYGLIMYSVMNSDSGRRLGMVLICWHLASLVGPEMTNGILTVIMVAIPKRLFSVPIIQTQQYHHYS